MPPALQTRASADSVVANAIATFTLTISSVGFSISLAVLIFGGALEAGLPRAIGSFVIGGGLIAVLVARRSQIVPVATIVQDGPAILMAVIAADFIGRDGTDVADVFVLIAVTTLATSLAINLLARFSLGELGRYLPKSVVCASIGGTGWLLFKGGFDVMTARNLGLADLRSMPSFELAKFWLPGCAIGVAAWLASRTTRLPAYAVGAIICAALGGFYVVAVLTSSISAVESAGWLLGPFPDSGGAQLVTPNEFRGANWTAIASMTPHILSVVVLACATQLLNLAVLRGELSPQLDVDAESRLSARANLASAVFAVTPGFQGLGYTMLLGRLGATRREVALVAGGLAVAIGIIGVAAIGYIPRFIIGAVLVMTGVALLEDWWRGLRQTATGAEQLLGLIVIAAVMTFGLLQGIALSLVTAAAVFVVRCSRVDPIKSARSGLELCSRVDRSPHERKRLRATGHRLAVIELHGYLSFGSLPTLEDRLRDTVFAPARVDTLVIDFDGVTALDSSGRTLVAQLLQELRHSDIVVWVSTLNPRLREELLAAEPTLATLVTFSPSLDEALESAEDRLLVSTHSEARQHQLQRNLAKLSPELLSQCAAHRFEPGTVVMAQGAPSDGLLIVQRGRLTSFRVGPDGAQTRLRCFGEFTVAGEVGLITNTPRIADVIAEDVVDGWWLSADRYHELRASRPQLIFELHEFIVQAQAERTHHHTMEGHI